MGLLTILRICSGCLVLMVLLIRLLSIYIERIHTIVPCYMIFFDHLYICRFRGIEYRGRRIISEMQNFLWDCLRLMLTWADSFRWAFMSILLLIGLISIHYDLTQRIDVLYVLNYPVLLHVLYKTLLLALSNRGGPWWLSDRSVFDF